MATDSDSTTLTPQPWKFLGHLYAAEALISLDRISDAITHLNPENVTDVSLGVSSHEQEQASDKGDNEPMESVGKQTPQCYPSSVTSARTMMLFNLGSAYCLRSEYDKARKCLHQNVVIGLYHVERGVIGLYHVVGERGDCRYHVNVNVVIGLYHVNVVIGLHHVERGIGLYHVERGCIHDPSQGNPTRGNTSGSLSRTTER
ncbi:unnamed protein product [Ranitomeya imitator]|uniref:CCR4-NOT transcription complex subunit 10 n=1 Tax=Ranitomeya imitator TaxID=111125 RepID=A0ABN9M8G2_9NEOB|nr:unnamed protein product [Ranitomeya imitator]